MWAVMLQVNRIVVSVIGPGEPPSGVWLQWIMCELFCSSLQVNRLVSYYNEEDEADDTSDSEEDPDEGQ